MSLGIITGSGTHALPGFEGGEPLAVDTPYGVASVTSGEYAGVDALHLSRHGPGHVRLSSHVTHRANIWALKELGAAAVIGCTACGAVDPELNLGGLVVFDDLHFSSNRLPDGMLCTFFDEGDPERGHWILHGGPYSDGRARGARGRRGGVRPSCTGWRHLWLCRRTAIQHADARSPSSPAAGSRP